MAEIDDIQVGGIGMTYDEVLARLGPDQFRILLRNLIAAEREACANICERMVVGGRAWTEEQSAAGNALLAAAKNIRARNGEPSNG